MTDKTEILLPKLKALAIEKSGCDIEPCENKCFEQCVSIELGRVYLWYNTPDCSTRMVSMELN